MPEVEYPFYEAETRRWWRWMARLREREVLECVLAAGDDQEWDPAGDHIAADLFLLSIHERLWYAESAGLTEKQRLAYTDWALSFSLTDIAKSTLGGITYQAAKKVLDAALRKVGKVMESDRFHGWMLVYLEDVTRRKLF